MLCNWDQGDCISEENPLEVFVSSSHVTPRPVEDWNSPYGSVFEALSELWAPFTTVYLLRGEHALTPIPADTSLHVLVPIPHIVTITTYFCQSGTDTQTECATDPATIRITEFDVGFVVSTELTIRDIIFRGGYPMKPACQEASCTYCPAVSLDLATNQWRTDKGQYIPQEKFAEQSLCDFFQHSALLTLSPDSRLSLVNVSLQDMRRQLKAIILNQCGDLSLQNVTFSNIMTRRLGLNGGVIQQVPMQAKKPYYCGSFVYEGGLVEFLNNGFEFSDTTYFSGFLWLSDLHQITISNVQFTYNYMYVGDLEQSYGSALLYFNQFRQLSIHNCTFEYNIANTGAALYVYSTLSYPLVIKDGLAAEQLLQHISIQDCVFRANSGRVGAVIYMQFLQDHPNILIRNNEFRGNFATERGILDIDFTYLDQKYTTGTTIQVLVESSVQSVFISPVSTLFLGLNFTSNYAPMLVYVYNVANFLLKDSLVLDSGDSMSGLDFANSVLARYVQHPETYMTIEPSLDSETSCQETIHIENSYNASVISSVFQALYCPVGSPGFNILGKSQFVSDI